MSLFFVIGSLTNYVANFIWPMDDLHLIMLLENFVFWWILLAFDAAVINSSQIGGLYFITFYTAGAFLALLVAFLPYLPYSAPWPIRQSTIHVSYATHHNSNSEPDDSADPTEETPLIQRVPDARPRAGEPGKSAEWLWIVEYLLAVPFPVILVTQLGLLLLTALSQTLADGNSPQLGVCPSHPYMFS